MCDLHLSLQVFRVLPSCALFFRAARCLPSLVADQQLHGASPTGAAPERGGSTAWQPPQWSPPISALSLPAHPLRRPLAPRPAEQEPPGGSTPPPRSEPA